MHLALRIIAALAVSVLVHTLLADHNLLVGLALFGMTWWLTGKFSRIS